MSLLQNLLKILLWMSLVIFISELSMIRDLVVVIVDDKSRNADGNNDHIPNIQEDTGCENDGSVPTGEELPADNAHDDADGNRETLEAHDDGSGNTMIIPRSSGDCSSAPQSITETVKVSDQFDSSQSAGSQAKRRLSTSSASANNEGGCSTIAERTRSRRASFSPESAAHALGQHDFVKNPKSILRKKNTKRLASRFSPRSWQK
ncbi:hypothetical protein PVAP13_2KG322000 [Panicum virgatum]|uniref:Uncharacterized protein n=1 Tax=Panicum virgatum TaxID=38727 RepID=A0A8T0W7R0_PANVG|nr:hypothetical protein PVAP13_2KG322000 [Panicum virgatum]